MFLNKLLKNTSRSIGRRCIITGKAARRVVKVRCRIAVKAARIIVEIGGTAKKKSSEKSSGGEMSLRIIRQ